MTSRNINTALDSHVIRHTSLAYILRELLAYQEAGYQVDLNNVREFGIQKVISVKKTNLESKVSPKGTSEDTLNESSPIQGGNTIDETDATNSDTQNDAEVDSFVAKPVVSKTRKTSPPKDLSGTPK